METKPFSGFYKETLIYLNELKNNNNKQWFDENKDRYKKFVVEPFRSLTVGLLPYMVSIDPFMEVNNPNRMISRINRDIRFSKDKSPYRSNLWITFRRASLDWKLSPCFYFELFPDYYRYGMGFYDVSKDTMDNLRSFIEDKPSEFRKIIKAVESRNKFLLQGDRYKRTINSNIPEEFIEWYQKKNLYINYDREIDDLLFSGDLIGKVAGDFKELISLYEFLWKIKK
jgi:uncharacterized protein (TIGR02453 family)